MGSLIKILIHSVNTDTVLRMYQSLINHNMASEFALQIHLVDDFRQLLRTH